LLCSEYSGNHRPNHHASEAQHIEEALDALYNELELWALYIARFIYTLVEATTVSQRYAALRIA
jgi:hypothetical protein